MAKMTCTSWTALTNQPDNDPEAEAVREFGRRVSWWRRTRVPYMAVGAGVLLMPLIGLGIAVAQARSEARLIATEPLPRMTAVSQPPNANAFEDRVTTEIPSFALRNDH